MAFKIGDEIMVVIPIEQNAVGIGSVGIVIQKETWEESEDIQDSFEDKLDYDNYTRVNYSKLLDNDGTERKPSKNYYTLTDRLKLIKVTNWRGRIEE